MTSTTETTAAEITIKPPTPQQVDTLIDLYQQQDVIADESRAIADQLERELIDLVRAFGSIPESANQSKRLQGIHSLATVILGVTRSLKEERIIALRDYMIERDLLDLFNLMFSASTKYTLIDGAHDVLIGVKLADRTREKILSLFGMCIDVKDKKPSLKVQAVKPEKPARAKKAKAGKAVA
ncbi:MAG TPA: hypothetical protein VGN16_21040 [Acidobacteriaceae bacterium]|jgi:hypothetical protein